MSNEDKNLFWIVLLIVSILIIVFIGFMKVSNECEEKGGKYIQTKYGGSCIKKEYFIEL